MSNSTPNRVTDKTRNGPAGRARASQLPTTSSRMSTTSKMTAGGSTRMLSPGSKQPPPLPGRRTGVSAPSNKPEQAGPASAAVAPKPIRRAGASPPSKQPPPRPGQKVTVPVPRKPLYPQPAVDQWKEKFEQQCAETQRLQNEKAQVGDDLRRFVAEQEEKTAATEARLKAYDQAVREAEKVADHNAKLQFSLENLREEIADLKTAKDKLSMELVFSRDQAGKLYNQAKVAGQLQTELNAARNVRIPQLEQDNSTLKQALRQLNELANKSRGGEEVAVIRADNQKLLEEIEKLDNAFKASEVLLLEDQEYIQKLEVANEKANCELSHAVQAFTKKDHRIAALESNSSDPTVDFADRIQQMTQDYGNLEAQNQQLGIQLQAANDAVSKASDERTATPVLELVGIVSAIQPEPLPHPKPVLQLSAVHAAIQTEPLPPKEPALELTGVHAAVHTEPFLLPELDTADAMSISTQSTEYISPPAPRPPLDQDLRITINVGSTNYPKLALLERLASVTTRGTSFAINGPADITKALTNRMEDAQAEAVYSKARISQLQQMLWHNIREVERSKEESCSLPEHGKLAEHLAAKESQLEMQDLMLADYGRQLARLHGQGGNGKT